MGMTTEDYQRIVITYKGPFCQVPPDVVADIDLLLETVLAQAAVTTKLQALIGQVQGEQRGWFATMQALTRALGGTVEIPFAAVESLHPEDRLHVADVETPHGLMKRFSFTAHDAAAAPAAAAPAPPAPILTFPRRH